jgi:formylglycine-generating enzyme required for sulfatase activity
LSAAVAAGALGAPAQPNAAAVVEEIAAALPGSARLAQARDIVAGAQLRAARKARAGGDFEAAEAALGAAIAIKPGPALADAVKTESALLGRYRAASGAEREALAAELKAQADAVTTQVEQALAGMKPTVDDARTVLAVLDKLEAADPGNVRIEATRSAVAKRLAEGADLANEAGDWDGAVESLREAIALVPEAGQLGESLGALQADAQTALANAQKKAIENGKAQLEKLLADKAFDPAWDRAVQSELGKLQPFLAADDPWLTATSTKFATAYIERSAQMRTEQRYEEAANSLAKAERYGPQLEALAAEKSALAAAQAEFEKARAEELKLAELEGLKSTLAAQAKAKDVSNAKKALDKLRTLLPAEDPYLTTEIPKLLGDAYVNTAKSQADKKNFLAALKVAREGLEIAPNHPGLTKVVREYTVEGNKAELMPMFSGEFTDIDVDSARKKIDEIQQVNATEGSSVAGALEKLLVDRVEALRAPQPTIARDLLEQGKQLFPGGTLIAAVKPVEEKRELKPCKNCAQAQSALKGRQLSKAQSIVADAKADPADKDHPDLVRVENALNKAVTAANAALEEFDALQKEIAAKPKKTRDELENLTALLDKARDLWSDRDYKAQDDWLESELAKLPKKPEIVGGGYPGQVTGKAAVVPYAGKSPQQCSEKLATYGTRAKGQCFDLVDAEKPGPPLVVVPAGAGGKAFAISRFEIRYGDYNRFCTVSGWCKPIPVPKENLTLPVTQISLSDAKAYAEWLSRRTGDTYRLPTAEEWAYAAEAGGKQPKKDWNCRLEQGGQILKGQGVMAVNSSKPNGWGLYQYVGNVQEWVTAGGAAAVRGGSYQDSYSKCDISLERPHDGTRDEATGFRLVRELG